MPQTRKHQTVRWAVAFVLLAALLVAGVYAMQRQGYRLDDAFTTVVEKSTDAATAARVETALALSRRVSAFDIDVDAASGAVTLRGSVPSAEVRELAGSIVADTTGVRDVRNLLEVDPKVSPDPEVERLVARVAELELQTALLEAMRSDPALREVVPEVGEGRIALHGAIASEADRQLAWEVARRFAGDAALDDQLRVSSAATGEVGFAERVEFALYSSGAFDLGRIEVVERAGGEVALRGAVRSRAEQLLAEQLAREVGGVEAVVNELQVRAEVPVTAERSEEGGAPG